MTKILLADDSVTIQKVVELTFSDEESQVIAVGDGASAFEKAQMDRPDIILSDVVMPGMSGYELCYKIKTDPGLKSIPFLFLKGTFESFDEDKAKESGADGFIVKPFESQELVNKVKELIARSASFQAPSPTHEATPPQPEAAAAPPPPPAPAPPPPPPPPPMDVAPMTAAPAAAEAPEPVSAAAPEAEKDLFADEGAAPGGSKEEDLWSEVSLRDTKTPLVEDNVLEDESFWGTSGDLEAGKEAAGGAMATEEDLIEEVGEAEIMDLTEEAPVPAAPAQAAEEPEELFGAFEDADAAPVQEEAAPPAMEPPAQGPEEPAAAAPPDLENVLGAKIEDAIRSHLGPVISETAAKIVEEVAWEIIPDLAEAMIKSEIERIRKEADGR